MREGLGNLYINLEGFVGSAEPASSGAHIHPPISCCRMPHFPYQVLDLCITHPPWLSVLGFSRETESGERERWQEGSRFYYDKLTHIYVEKQVPPSALYRLETQESLLFQSPKVWEPGKPRTRDPCPSWSNQAVRGEFLHPPPYVLFRLPTDWLMFTHIHIRGG